MSPAARRRAVNQACESLGVSERRACRVLGQSRSTQRYESRVSDDEAALVKRVVALASEYGRYGYRRVTVLLRAEGWRVNHKRVERIWRAEGLRVPRKQPKRKRLWLNDGSCVRLRPEHRDHVWTYDFVFERTMDGRPLKLLTMLDEYTRECLAIEVGRKLSSEGVSRVLGQLFVRRGIPSYNGKLRDELLNGELFTSLREARILIEAWRREYNQVRPHSSLGYRPPAPEAVMPRPSATASYL